MHICVFFLQQVMQKQMLGEVENWMAVWWPIVSWMCVPKKLLKLDHPSSSYGKKIRAFFMPHSRYQDGSPSYHAAVL